MHPKKKKEKKDSHNNIVKYFSHLSLVYFLFMLKTKHNANQTRIQSSKVNIGNKANEKDKTV